METGQSSKNRFSFRMVLLGSRSVGKTSVVNTILGFKEGEEGKRTGHSMKHQGVVGTTKISVVDTPGWWKEFSAYDTPEAIKDEVKRSVFLCPPGPHVFLLVIDADTAFNGRHLKAVTTHLELLGDAVWKHTIVVFTRGDWLESHTIEQHIEGEGEALQSLSEHRPLLELVEKCNNRYHVINNLKKHDTTQVTELRRQIKNQMRQQMEQEISRRKHEWLIHSRDVFLDLQADLRGSAPRAKPKLQSEYFTVVYMCVFWNCTGFLLLFGKTSLNEMYS
uniref:AIG1-type G domain-containing protein n=1 Tax=Salarias fasciatus TaxID=181472 RepID=A0A672H438_SALFA